MHTPDFLIAGGGLAGSLLAWYLHTGGAAVALADAAHPGAAWRTASGLITPITGRRLAKTQMLDALLPFAKNFYRAVEQQYGAPLFAELPTVRVFGSGGERTLWEERRYDAGYDIYMQPAQTNEPIGVQAPFGTGVMTGSGKLDIAPLLECLRSELPLTSIIKKPLRTEEIHIARDCVTWGAIQARTLVFCEGWRGIHNPLFQFVPIMPSHGETLVIRTTGIPEDCILSGGVHIAPIGAGLFKVGATNHWTKFEEETTEAGKEELRHRLDAMLRVPYSIVEHTAGIRPAIKDRRPVAGLHPDYPNIGILNGLGSKGALFGPKTASLFADFLLHGNALPAEFSIERFIAQPA